MSAFSVCLHRHDSLFLSVTCMYGFSGEREASARKESFTAEAILRLEDRLATARAEAEEARSTAEKSVAEMSRRCNLIIIFFLN